MTRKATAKPGTRAGVSETVVEMAAEYIDPAMWAAMQLTKPDQPPAKTVGEVHERIRAIVAQAMGMTKAARANKALCRLNVLAAAYDAQERTARDPKWKRKRRTQAETMREAASVVKFYMGDRF